MISYIRVTCHLCGESESRCCARGTWEHPICRRCHRDPRRGIDIATKRAVHEALAEVDAILRGDREPTP